MREKVFSRFALFASNFSIKLSIRHLIIWREIELNLKFSISVPIGPLHDPVTWYKITYTGEQIAQWDFQNNAPAFVLEVPLCNLLSSICNFVPCDRVVQRAHSFQMGKCSWDYADLPTAFHNNSLLKN